MTSHYLDRAEALESAIDRWRTAPAIGLDTEFIRTRTFYPIPALYQVATTEAIYLLDPLPVEGWAEFSGLLCDPDVVKVMHACSEDLEVFARHLEVAPRGLFDTQVAAGFLGTDFSLSYAALVERYIGATLGKHATRSDWLARPLSPAQLHYAEEDVAHLLALHDALVHGLRETGRLAWFEDENRRRTATSSVEPEDYYRTLRKAWRYGPRQLARLQGLCAWREWRARARDLPRQRVIRDEHLLTLAAQEGDRRTAIFEALPPPVAQRFWRDLLEVLETAADRPEMELPEPLEPPLTQRQAERVKRLRQVAHEQAQQLGMAEELLGRRRDVEACFRHFAAHGELDELFLGWRYELVGERFESILGGASA